MSLGGKNSCALLHLSHHIGKLLCFAIVLSVLALRPELWVRRAGPMPARCQWVVSIRG